TVDHAGPEIAELHATVAAAIGSAPTSSSGGSALTPRLDDDEVLMLALAAQNGNDVQKLWDGDTSANSGDASAADLALCGYLAFWTGKNAEQMDRLFRRSKLMRDKWDENRGGQTYGERTVTKAIDGCTAIYTHDELAGPYTDVTRARRLARKSGK